MSKSRNYDKELKQIDRLKYENKQLKQKNASLRRQLSRIDVDRYQNLQELVQQQDAEERELVAQRDMKKKWGCFECGAGYLKLMIINRRDGVFYYRCCSSLNCDKKTKLQRYTPEVQGVVEEDDGT